MGHVNPQATVPGTRVGAGDGVIDAQDEAYRESVLPANVAARVAVEAGIADYWYKYVGLKGAIVGMRGYGESAPADKLFPYFGFTVENVVEQALSIM